MIISGIQLYGNFATGNPVPTGKRRVVMFKPQFAPKVQEGTKRQTIRPVPKREVRPGTLLSLRKWKCRPYNSQQVVLCEYPLRFWCHVIIGGDLIMLKQGQIERRLDAMDELDYFAELDGFTDWGSMRRWFEQEHGKLPFTGVLFNWDWDLQLS